MVGGDGDEPPHVVGPGVGECLVDSCPAVGGRLGRARLAGGRIGRVVVAQVEVAVRVDPARRRRAPEERLAGHGPAGAAVGVSRGNRGAPFSTGRPPG